MMFIQWRVVIKSLQPAKPTFRYPTKEMLLKKTIS